MTGENDWRNNDWRKSLAKMTGGTMTGENDWRNRERKLRTVIHYRLDPTVNLEGSHYGGGRAEYCFRSLFSVLEIVTVFRAVLSDYLYLRSAAGVVLDFSGLPDVQYNPHCPHRSERQGRVMPEKSNTTWDAETACGHHPNSAAEMVGNPSTPTHRIAAARCVRTAPKPTVNALYSQLRPFFSRCTLVEH